MGEVFAGRYELADPIGRGGVGAVWRAWDHRRRRYVAAKVLQQRDAHSLLRFVREQALRIDHPHVLAPASWAADDDKVLFTMDLVAGGSLVHLVGDYGPLPPAFVCTLLDQLLSGLAAVHAEGVVHRDIKPANVLLEATGTGRPRLRLSDFGIAMRFGEPRLTETNLVVGTPGYLAPEQLLGAEPDFPADLFAVGLVALYLLEGAKPDAKALVQYFMEHGTPGPPKGIPEPLWQVVATLLQPDPVARFRTATGARKALASAVELLPEPGLDDEPIEIFDQLGPLPPGFGPEGPARGPLKGRPESAARAGTGALDTTGTATGGSESSAGSPTGGSETSTGPASGGSEASTGPATGSAEASSAEASTGPATGSSRAGVSSATSRPTGSEIPASQGGIPADPRRDSDSLSDTGSFRIPPPRAAEPTPPTQAPHPAAPPPYAPPHTAWSAAPPPPWTAPPSPAPTQPGDTATAAYTARDARALPSAPRTPAAHGRRARRRDRRPGPPAKAAIPILLLALACYAVGFWALTRV
jgi:serine/threonine protein kinase